MRTFKLKDSIYKTHITIFIGSLADYNKRLCQFNLKEQQDDEVKGEFQRFSLNNKGYYWVFVRGGQSRSETINTLAHELVHLVMCRFDDCSVPISRKNDEVFAYFYASLLEQAINKI